MPASWPRFAVFLVALVVVALLIEARRRAEESRRRAAQQVERSESHLAEAQRLGQIGSWACIPGAPGAPEVGYWSKELFRIMGLPVQERPPASSDVASRFGPEAWAGVLELFTGARWEKLPCEGEFPLTTPDGSPRIVRIVINPVLDRSGEIVELVGAVVDITEQRRASAALQSAFEDIRRSEYQLRTIINAIPTLAWSTRPDGSVDFFNQRWLDYTGLSMEQALDWGWTAAVHPDDNLNPLIEHWSNTRASGNPAETEARLRRFDGEYRWFLFHGNPVRDETGTIVKWYGTNADIQDRKQAEEALRASERSFRLMVDSIPGFVSTRTPAGEPEFVNRQTMDFFGKSLEESTDWSAFLHPEDRESVVGRWLHSVETGQPFDGEFRARRADGVYRWLHSRVNPLRDPEGRIVRWYNLITDVDDRKQAEEALRASERELGLILEAIPALVWCADPKGELTYVNQRVLDYTGTTLDALAQVGWLDYLHPDDVQPTMRAWSHAVATGRPHDVRYRLRRFDGLYRWFHVLGQPTRGTDGGVTRWYGLLVDIDDRKNMEEALRSTQARLSRATQVATVGELAASIAHEINQPLAAVVANGHACLRWLSCDPPTLARAYEAAERIVRDGKEAGEVVRRVRALFKRATLEKVPLDLNEVIGEVLGLLASETGKRRVFVETELDRCLPTVVGDRLQLQQLLFNLLLNGIEAMDAVANRPRKLTIRSTRQTDSSVLVEIHDCGTGLKDPDRAFEAFFTTKENGLGMGLAVCRSIVEAHGGRLWAVAEQAAGTSFFVNLPLQEEPAA